MSPCMAFESTQAIALSCLWGPQSLAHCVSLGSDILSLARAVLDNQTFDAIINFFYIRLIVIFFWLANKGKTIIFCCTKCCWWGIPEIGTGKKVVKIIEKQWELFFIEVFLWTIFLFILHAMTIVTSYFRFKTIHNQSETNSLYLKAHNKWHETLVFVIFVIHCQVYY